MNIQEIRAELLETRRAKGDIITQKNELQAKMTALNNEVRTGGRMPNRHYQQLCDEQTLVVRQIGEVERFIGNTNLKIQELSNLEHEKYKELKVSSATDEEPNQDSVIEVRLLVRDLAALRQSYQDFAADSTRVSSMRQMAAEFVVKLNPIIRNAVNQSK